MEKEFVPFELAVKMKELGFDKNCLAYFEGEKVCFAFDDGCSASLVELQNSKYNTVAPLWQQAFDWFREVHNHHVNITRTYGSEFMPYIDGQELNYDNAKYQWIYHTHEEARTACLEKLIEIVNP